MKTPKKINWEIKRIAMPAGGLFVGARLQFPVNIWDGDYPGYVGSKTTYSSSILSIGLLLWQIDVEFKYSIKPIIKE